MARSGVNIVTAHPIVDGVLDEHRGVLGAHLPAYRNHVYRGLNYQQLLLHAPVADAAALAWAVHDLGVWTANTFDYLEPSAQLGSAHAASATSGGWSPNITRCAVPAIG